MRINLHFLNQRDRDRDKETLSYNVERKYETSWTHAKASNNTCIMPVLDMNDYAIKADLFADKLIGPMCEITFTLKHYSIGGQMKPDGTRVEAHDVFSAQVESVAILKKAPVIARSSFKGWTKRPQHRPQIPTRGEQVNTATAFVPQPLPPAIADDATELSSPPPTATPIDGITTGEMLVTTINNRQSITRASTSGPSKDSQVRESMEANSSVTQAPTKKHKVRE